MEIHEFSAPFAVEYGIRQAILFHYLYTHTREKGRNNIIEQGKIWIMISLSGLRKQMPYLSRKLVLSCINQLVADGFVYKRNLNLETGAVTNWYAINEDAIQEFYNTGVMNGRLS